MREYDKHISSSSWRTLSLEFILSSYKDGDERGWDVEFEFLRREHRQRLDALATSIQETGIQVPILLGTDGRIWDGHHRLCVAQELGISPVPVEYVDKPLCGDPGSGIGCVTANCTHDGNWVEDRGGLT